MIANYYRPTAPQPRYEVTRVDALNLLDTEWQDHLSAPEISILTFVISRTCRWGKQWERIPREHFCGGVWNRQSGEVVIRGLSMTEKTLTKWLRALMDKGLLLRKGANVYSVNMNWRPDRSNEVQPVNRLQNFQDNPNHDTDMLAIPKKTATSLPKLALPKRAESVQETPEEYQEKGYFREGKKGKKGGPYKEGNEGGDTVAGQARTTVSLPEEEPVERGESEEILARLSGEVSRTRKKRDAAIAAGRIPAGVALAKMFDEHTASSFPGKREVQATGVEAAILRRCAQRACQAMALPAFLEMMKWCIETWPLLQGSDFSWMKSAPEKLTIRLFASMIRQFMDCWKQSRRIESYRDMDPREAHIDMEMRKGRSREAAERAADQKFGSRGAEIDRKAAEALKRAEAALKNTAEQQRKDRLREDIARNRQILANRKAGQAIGFQEYEDATLKEDAENN